MKLNEIKCDNCDKNSKFKCKELNGLNGINTSNDDIDETSTSFTSSNTNNNKHSTDQDYESHCESFEYKNQQVVAKCTDCNFYLCSNCLLDHQFAYANHQLMSLNTELANNNSKSFTISSSKPALFQQHHSSNLAQLQQQYIQLEDQVLVKRRQQQQQQQAQQQLLINNHHQQQHQQMLQQNKLIQIENEIQKSYNFYIQMLKERRDYLINELNTIVQYALLSHTQNYNKQLKIKNELEQKRQSLEIAEAVATALANESSESKLLNDSMNNNTNNGYNTKLRDNNNNKISAGLAEITSLQVINNQLLNQLKQSNPLNSIEFVSNYSAIQTSIRNTFGYIRIRDTTTSSSKQETSSSAAAAAGAVFSTANLSNTNVAQPNASEFIAALKKNQTAKSNYHQNELKILTDFDSSNSATTSGSATNMFSNKFDYFKQNTLSSNSSTSSVVSSMSSTSSLSSSSSNVAVVPISQQQQQSNKQEQTTTTTTNDYDFSSPVSAQASNSHIYNNLSTAAAVANENYFLDQYLTYPKLTNSKNDWPSNGSLNHLLNGNKSELNSLVLNENISLNDSNDFLSNNNKSKSCVWPLIPNLNETDLNEDVKLDDDLTQSSKADVENLIYSTFFLNSGLDNQQQQLQQHEDLTISPPFLPLKDHMSKLNGLSLANRLNNSAITPPLNNSSKSIGSSSIGSLHHQNNLIHLSNQQLLTSPEDRSSSSTTSSSSPVSDSANYQDSNLALSNKQQNSLIANCGSSSISSSVTSSASSSASSSSRSQLRRSKMIYHCKFGEFGITDGQFTEPSGVTINTNNDIIVADTNSHRIQIFDKDGRFKFKFGECGKRDGQLLYPNRVSVVKQTGDIVVTERSPTHQIQIYNKYGQFLRKFGANILQHPRGVCVDSKGRIIVVECKVMRVLIFDLMGNVLQKFNCSKYLEFPNGVCCSNTNDREEIYISDNRAHCIKVFDYNGNFVRQIGGEGITNYPIGVGINSNNEILVADNHNNFNLTVFSQDGQLLNALESKVKHAQCFDVGLMDDGSIVLASKDYRIYVYKYLNSSYNLSNSICNADTQLLSLNSNDNNNNNNNNETCVSNESNVISTLNSNNNNNNEASLYGLFSPSNYNQLVGHLNSMANFNFNTSFISEE